MELSRQRLETVARFCARQGTLASWRWCRKGGKRFPIADRDWLPKEDAFQLDWRVELHLKQ